ncbi:MAG: s-methyl-5-thioribose-1-phosphate isomerase [Tissierellia bacterium]|nr:s-methyl-5-thioribose-1-phosphate isomerase [Tissierellia bacterium]
MKRMDKDLAFMLRYENVAWYENGKVKILDRRIYPIEVNFVECSNHKEVAQAIADMVTQSGGPYVAAGMGMALAAYEARNKNEDDLITYLEDAAYTLSHARPTTTENMKNVTEAALKTARDALKEGKRVDEAIFEDVINNSNRKYEKISQVASYLVNNFPKNGIVMTQCFAETIVGFMVLESRNQNKDIKYICPETRPYLQGARLTASVINDMGADVTVITDNMPAYIIGKKKVDLFTSAADVITMDGYVVNKVGTFQIALAANYWGIPYFVTGAPNQGHPDVNSVTIEERDPELVLYSLDTKHTMEGVKGLYPAFDITPPHLCSGVVTDKGVFSPFDLKNYYMDAKGRHISSDDILI